MANRRKFNAEFRAEAVELVISSGRPVAQIAPEIGVVEGTLGNWVRLWKEDHPEAGGGGGGGAAEPGPVEWAKYKALQAENAGQAGRAPHRPAGRRARRRGRRSGFRRRG